jgi:hypothetical protein
MDLNPLRRVAALQGRCEVCYTTDEIFNDGSSIWYASDRATFVYIAFALISGDLKVESRSECLQPFPFILVAVVVFCHRWGDV